ncbi:MAG: hypothetical protein HY207_10775 [Nitrospirae bacterium]|nr:hypothetical protein [Nitrospirota bacterium]
MTGKRTVVVAAVCALLVAGAAVPNVARAQDDALAGVLVDGFYGGLVGALVGTAVMALTSHPKEHLSYITSGAGIGAIGGTLYGLSKVANRAFVDVDRGRVTWRAPDITTTASSDPDGRSHPIYSVAVLRYHFE